MAPTVMRKWWKDGLVYQIWPASYKDGNGDGVGDIAGILSTLDHLQSLGVNIIWISPAYASPQKDMGYDISDYESIDPTYGTVADAEKLIKECHQRGMRVIFDLVVNHTSDQHAWFKESRSSKDSPKRDWYIWRAPKYDSDGTRHPPTNWRSLFGGSAWQWDEETQEYYLHLFVPEQPDLNWENPKTRNAIYDSAMRFWLDKGIDGFRVDTVNMYSKPTNFLDAPVTLPDEQYQPAPDMYCNGPRMYEFLSEMHREVLSKYDCMTVGELPHTKEKEQVLKYVSAEAKRLDMVFQFEVVSVGRGENDHWEELPFELANFKKAINFTQSLASDPTNDGWGTAFLENHDVARSVSRFANETPEHRGRSAKLLATMLASLSGTLFLYQGQEVGMANAPSSWPPEDYKDVDSINHIKETREKYAGTPELEAQLRKAMHSLQRLSRDHARTPVHWSSAKNAGFSPPDAAKEPWMRVNEDYKDGWNVADQDKDENSLLNYWRRILRLRKEHVDTCVYGTFRVCEGGNENVFALVKGAVDDSEQLLVVLNFSSEKQKLELESGLKLGKRLVDNVDGSSDDTLEPWEARWYQLA